MSVKLEMDWPKTVGGVAGRRYILPMHFCSIRARKKSVKNEKIVIKNNFRILKKTIYISSDHPKSACKV